MVLASGATMIRIGRDKTFGAFDKSIPPVITVRPGDVLCLETEDSHDGTIRSEADRYYTERFRPNPATGPVAVEGVEPGDALTLEILEIRPGPLGYTTIRPTWGLITGVVDRPQAKILRVEGNDVIFAPGVRFPIRPMIGTIGTAPAGEPVSNMYAGPHGGNMDNNDVAPGATVFLPVNVPGALFGLGDVHASMGDGELSGGGFDLPSEVTLRVGLKKGMALRWPRLEREGRVGTMAAHADCLETMRIAVDEMVGILRERLQLSRADALMLLSVRGDVQVCTCHNHPQAGFTMRVSFPKIWAD
jgi:amidase